MKRARNSTTNKSTDSVVTGKDEPPKKVSKKRIKPSTQSSSPQSTATTVQPPAVVPKPGHSPPSNSVLKLGSLPMYGEDVPKNGYATVPKLAESTCDNLRSIMGKIKEFKTKGGVKAEAKIELLKQKGIVNFITLKKLNRLSHMYCKDAREQTHEQKLGVDDLHLQLQNLMYEAMHLRKEITNCLEFKSRHEEIDLISEAELSSTVSLQPVDSEHEGMLRRLEWELEERKRLAEQQRCLEQNITEEEEGIRIKEENLSNILPTLEGIRKATLPLQESLGIPLDKKREEQEMALLLPSSLYIFLMQAKAYSEIEDSSLAVSVSGDVGEAKTFQSCQQDKSDDESGDSDAEGGEKEQRKKRRNREKSSVEGKISKAHPLTIVCSITLKELGSFQFTFTYLPHFSVVCASVSSVTVVGVSDDLLSTYLDKSSLLHCLTWGDTGRTSPNAIVSFHIRKHGNEVFSSAVRTYGFPYKWVQRVCGINDHTEVPDRICNEQVEVSAENMGTVVNRLKQRFQAQIYLLRQIVSLSSDEPKMTLGLQTSGMLHGQANSKLIKWKQLTLAEFQSAVTLFVSQSIFNQLERTNKFYLGVFQHDNHKVHLKCLVCVGADYPYSPPTIAIMIEEMELKEIQIKNIEAEVNIRFPRSVKESDRCGQYLLCRQLHRLQCCFDMYMEYKKLADCGVGSDKLRGKGRLLILDI